MLTKNYRNNWKARKLLLATKLDIAIRGRHWATGKLPPSCCRANIMVTFSRKAIWKYLELAKANWIFSVEGLKATQERCAPKNKLYLIMYSNTLYLLNNTITLEYVLWQHQRNMWQWYHHRNVIYNGQNHFNISYKKRPNCQPGGNAPRLTHWIPGPSSKYQHWPQRGWQGRWPPPTNVQSVTQPPHEANICTKI